MLYNEKEKYKSAESKTMFSFVAIVLFILRSWLMFYLMKLGMQGVFSTIEICFILTLVSALIFLFMSILNRRYSPHSVFYYWKTLLICGVVKAIQLCLWVYELAIGGPVLCILFEQSPRLLFVLFGLLFGKYPGNGFYYTVGILITLGGYILAFFGMPESSTLLPKNLVHMLDSGISSTTNNPLLCLILVVISSLLNIFYNYQTHQISNINGSPYSIQSCCYFIASLFYFLFNYFMNDHSILFTTHLPSKNVFISLSVCSFICLVSMFYLHSLNNRYISERYTTKLGHYVSLLSVFILDRVSNTSSVSNTIIIASVIVSIGYFFLNLPIKKIKNQKQKGAFFRFMSFVFRSKSSRKIFLYLSINLAFMFVELIVGIINNSLGLVSDAGHMLFDSSALIIGLIASYMAEWPSSSTYSFGYKRVEVLSGFINGIFLVFVGCSVAMESIERFREPPEVGDNQLMSTSVGGLIVNLIGLVFFHDVSHAGHDHGHEHSHGHSHSHEHEHNDNMRGVFLHVLADTLGSVGVIISTYLIEKYDMKIADPICAFIISILILMSVFPLVQHSSLILLHHTPEGKEYMFKDISEAICGLKHVQGIAKEHYFIYTGETVLYSIKILVDEGCENEVKKVVEDLLNQLGISEHTIDVTSVKDEEFKMIHSSLSIENVVSQYIHDHHHECEHEHDHHDHECEHDHHHEHECEHEHHEHHEHEHHDHEEHHHNHDEHEHHHDEHHHQQPINPNIYNRLPANLEDPHFQETLNMVRNTKRAQKLLISSGKLD